ncbi:MAG: DUF4303 domain-containing protein [Actinobacteria bacterium]|nr:DUF4303 domain-containing protein [Actinomycetota bacterium]
MGVPTSATYDLVRVAVREAARSAWDDLRSVHPSESFYYFGLATTAQSHRPAPTAASYDGLARTVAGYRHQGVELLPDELRWSELESPFAFFGDTHFHEVERLFDGLGDPFERSAAVNGRLREAMVAALADLDADGVFGVGAQREAVVVNVTVPGDGDAALELASARRLNPPAALDRYENDRAL